MYQPNPVSSIGPTQSNPVAHEQMGPGGGDMVPSNGGNDNPNMAARQRLRWTNELHDRFVEAVTQLGGPDNSKTEKKDPGDLLAGLEGSSTMQISEALKLQMEVQKRLHEQLEVMMMPWIPLEFSM
nr:unnamed protein product [Digitaria exilis]